MNNSHCYYIHNNLHYFWHKKVEDKSLEDPLNCLMVAGALPKPYDDFHFVEVNYTFADFLNEDLKTLCISLVVAVAAVVAVVESNIAFAVLAVFVVVAQFQFQKVNLPPNRHLHF